jgi:GNAT superfamily N-acetyltransferase
MRRAAIADGSIERGLTRPADSPTCNVMATIRPATAADTSQAYDIFYGHETADEASAPPRRAVPELYRHEIETGRMLVAEQAGVVVAFAAIVARSGTVFLTDFFTRPGYQSSGVGKPLLQRILPHDGTPCFASSSEDPRAVSLYIRAGMLPLFPVYSLIAAGDGLGELPGAEIDVVPGRSDDPEILRWDEEIGGRQRPEDYRYWARATQAVTLWFRRGTTTLGFGCVQMHNDEYVWYPEALTVGPVGARYPEDALACVCAAVQWARRQGPTTRIFVPAPHPALATLLRAGFRIHSADTFMSSTGSAFADVRRYLPSGGTLF